MKKLCIFTIMLFCLSGVLAIDFTLDTSTNTIVRGVENDVKLILTATNAQPGIYNLFTLSDMIITPIEPFEVNRSTFQKIFNLKPRKTLDAIEGRYAFSSTLNHRGFEKYDTRLIVNFVNLEDSISIYSESINSDSTQISFFVENLVNSDLKNLSAKFSSVLFEVERTFDLAANEKMEIFVYADIEQLKKIRAGVYLIEGVFETSYGQVEIEGNLYLGEKKGITSTEDKSGLLVRTQTITKVNSGNVVESVRVEMEQDIFSRFFTGFNVMPSTIERDGLNVKYTWQRERLQPAEAYTIRSRTNYFIPFFIIIFLVVGSIMIKRYTDTKLEIKKTVSPMRTKGGEFALKVQLYLKARANIENVKLSDRVPAMVRIYNKFGKVSPDKIDSKTRRLHWNIGDLIAGETRVFDYIVYSKVGIFGKFVLPEARGVFEKDNKVSEVPSNKVFFMNEQVDK